MPAANLIFVAQAAQIPFGVYESAEEALERVGMYMMEGRRIVGAE
jgi:hypothetical protein